MRKSHRYSECIEYGESSEGECIEYSEGQQQREGASLKNHNRLPFLQGGQGYSISRSHDSSCCSINIRLVVSNPLE